MQTVRKVTLFARYALHVQQFACARLNFGYFYPDSRLNAYDEGDVPGYTMYDYTPSTAPGCRTPHFWLSEGRSLYDAMGSDFTLLRFDPAINVTALVAAAARSSVPLTVLDVDADAIPEAYRHKLVLSRPDRHVAWRGNAVPEG